MSYAYNSQSIGDEITASKFNAVTAALGRRTDVGLYPTQSYTYAILVSGATYYRRDGSDGVEDDSNASAKTLIEAAIAALS